MKRAVFRHAIAALVLSYVFIGCAEASMRDAPVLVGKPAPAYAAVTLAGDSVSLAGQRGKVVLLNVWATWCHPCRAEIPELREIHAKYKDRGFEVLGVSIDADGSEESLAEFMSEFEMAYPVWLDPGERVSARFRTVGVPETFLIDKAGVLRWRKIGPIQPGDSALTNAIERALEAK